MHISLAFLAQKFPLPNFAFASHRQFSRLKSKKLLNAALSFWWGSVNISSVVLCHPRIRVCFESDASYTSASISAKQTPRETPGHPVRLLLQFRHTGAQLQSEHFCACCSVVGDVLI